LTSQLWACQASLAGLCGADIEQSLKAKRRGCQAMKMQQNCARELGMNHTAVDKFQALAHLEREELGLGRLPFVFPLTIHKIVLLTSITFGG
jgi:hypothetical protein